MNKSIVIIALAALAASCSSTPQAQSERDQIGVAKQREIGCVSLGHVFSVTLDSAEGDCPEPLQTNNIVDINAVHWLWPDVSWALDLDPMQTRVYDFRYDVNKCSTYSIEMYTFGWVSVTPYLMTHTYNALTATETGFTQVTDITVSSNENTVCTSRWNMTYTVIPAPDGPVPQFLD